MRALLFVVSVALSACALTSRAAPFEIRYFAPNVAARSVTTTSARASVTAPPKVCVRQITSSEFLRNPLVYRVSTYEVGSYDDRRWTEYPEVYLRRSLDHALFDGGRFVEGQPGRCPTLDVELLGFEELRRGDARAGRVQLVYRLFDGDRVVASEVVTIERDAGGTEPADIVAAIGTALEDATARLATGLEARFAAAASSVGSP